MANEVTTVSSGNAIAVSESTVAKIMSPEMSNALSEFKEEVHSILQLPPEDMVKISHIDCQLDWKPV